MKKNSFKEHEIKRTCTRVERDVQKYREDLKRDFNHHCGYCNLDESLIEPHPFQIDHFVPRAEFKGIRDSLETDYSNLVYSCPKCNRAKGKSFQGDFSKTKVDNELYYDPGSVDMNQYFYRDEMGSICSDDKKGQYMINKLKLKHPIHNSAWLVEELDKTYKMLEYQLDKETDEERAGLLRGAFDGLAHILLKQQALFRSSYYAKK